jgi:hypothetical protein
LSELQPSLLDHLPLTTGRVSTRGAASGRDSGVGITEAARQARFRRIAVTFIEHLMDFLLDAEDDEDEEILDDEDFDEEDAAEDEDEDPDAEDDEEEETWQVCVALTS